VTHKGKRRLAWIVGGGSALAIAALVFLWPRKAGASSRGIVGIWLDGPSDEIDDQLNALFGSSDIPLWFAFACAELESGFNARAYNPERGANTPEGEGSYGLFQIYWKAHQAALEAQHITQADLYDPRVNAIYWRAYVLRLASQVGATKNDAPSWEAVRLRLAGDRDGRPDDASDQARLDRYRPIAAKWQGRLGGESSSSRTTRGRRPFSSHFPQGIAG